MKKFVTRFLLVLFALAAFIGPFAVVLNSEQSKRTEQFLATEQEIARTKKEAATARYQYYLDVADRRNNLKQAMEDSKNQYEKLLAEQPDRIKEKQTTVTQTVIKPVKTQKVVEQQVTSTAASKPKASTKTKTS
jgi:hypothetical protein